jgi:hypothetical protein
MSLCPPESCQLNTAEHAVASQGAAAKTKFKIHAASAAGPENLEKMGTARAANAKLLLMSHPFRSTYDRFPAEIGPPFSPTLSRWNDL